MCLYERCVYADKATDLSGTSTKIHEHTRTPHNARVCSARSMSAAAATAAANLVRGHRATHTILIPHTNKYIKYSTSMINMFEYFYIIIDFGFALSHFSVDQRH